MEAIIDFIVVTICLPFYLAVWPFDVWSGTKDARRISQLACSNCNAPLQEITRRDVQSAGIRLRLTGGVSVDWDRMPRRCVLCPACGTTLCFDRLFRPTDCNGADAISHAGRDKSST